MENLENICLEKLNKILSEFNLKVSDVHSKLVSDWKYKLTYDNSNENWIVCYWTSVSDMLFEEQVCTIFDSLQYYQEVPRQSESLMLQYKDLSDAYSAIKCLRSNSLEEFIINCDLIGM